MSIITTSFFGSTASGGGGGAQLFDAYYAEIVNGGASASCGIRFSNNGVFTNTLGLGNVGITNWFSPTTASIGSSYEVKCTLTTGTFTTGVSGSWVSLASTVDYLVSVTGAGNYKQATFNCDIRRTSDSVVVASATFTIEADTTY